VPAPTISKTTDPCLSATAHPTSRKYVVFAFSTTCFLLLFVGPGGGGHKLRQQGTTRVKNTYMKAHIGHITILLVSGVHFGLESI